MDEVFVPLKKMAMNLDIRKLIIIIPDIFLDQKSLKMG